MEQLAVTPEGLKAQEQPAAPPFAKSWWAWIVSVVFHPLFIPVYVVAFLLFVHAQLFMGFSQADKFQTLFITLINMVGYPLVAVLLLKGLGFIKSVQMFNAKDRIIPYIACGIFFFWTYQVFREQAQYPRELVAFIFGVFLASSAALIINIYLRVSMHALGVGGLMGFFTLLALQGNMVMSWPLALAAVISGLVLTSRLFLRAHFATEVWVGFAAGVLTQVVAWLVFT